jgi:DNA repair protein RAD16
LRRTKQGRADDLCLPPKLIRIRKDQLDERENDFYQAIYTQSQAQFNTYVSSGTLLNNYAHIFDLLIRLRQAVDHPYLVIYSKSNPALQVPLLTTTNVDAHTQQQQRPVMDQKPFLTFCKSEEFENEEGKECGICHEDVEDAILAKCTHIFCRVCVEEYMESLPMEADATCPVCEKPLTIDLTTTKCSSNSNSNSNSNSKAEAEAESELDRILETQWTTQQIQTKKKILSRYHKHSILHRLSDLQSFQTSTKIEALMQELEHLKIRDPCGKAIVFSQFVNMLDIIQHRLTLGGIKCVKLSGNMSMDVRDQTLKAFREDSSITVFLISLKAGGVALNLTVASHIFLMDPWWNPAAENQAIDRVHRLGQFKPVQATRFIIAGTVEERILKLQEKKQLVFEGTVGANVSALTRLTEEDLRFLFNK